MEVVLFFVLLMIPITLLTLAVMREETDDTGRELWIWAAIAMILITAMYSNDYWLTLIIGFILYTPLMYVYYRLGRKLYHGWIKKKIT
jgi:predicted PurR-regulated permease PerM